MKTFKEFIAEADEVYFKSYSSAVAFALEKIKKAKLEYNEDEYFDIVATGSKKPSEGKTTSWKLPLYKDGKLVKKMLVVNVFGMPSGNYELNSYIS